MTVSVQCDSCTHEFEIDTSDSFVTVHPTRLAFPGWIEWDCPACGYENDQVFEPLELSP